MLLLAPSDDSELYKYLKCDYSLRRTERPSYVLGHRYRCKDKLCSSIVDPAEKTWFLGLRAIEKEPNPLLRSIKLCYSLLCGIGVGLAEQETEFNPNTSRKIYRLVRCISSHHFKSTTWTIGGPGCTIECDESHIFKRKYG
jgi:hypothetical protein